jgi:hypothetical protein
VIVSVNPRRVAMTRVSASRRERARVRETIDRLLF